MIGCTITRHAKAPVATVFATATELRKRYFVMAEIAREDAAIAALNPR
jgi:hypothetical protein